LPQEQYAALEQFASAIGVAFQIKDDILDVEGDTEVIGKPAGSDVSLNKATYPSLFGIDASRKRCDELVESGIGHLQIFDASADSLRWLASYITERGH
jgi:geranylgeranyl pyrophosphate synthase